MKTKYVPAVMTIAVALTVLGGWVTIAQDKYS
jgi:hypothetical protein